EKDTEKWYAFRQSLWGDAWDWFLELGKFDPRDWAIVEACFKAAFKMPSRMEERTVDEQVEAFKRHPLENIASFLARADSLKLRCDAVQRRQMRDNILHRLGPKAVDGHVRRLAIHDLEMAGCSNADGELYDWCTYLRVRHAIMRVVERAGMDTSPCTGKDEIDKPVFDDARTPESRNVPASYCSDVCPTATSEGTNQSDNAGEYDNSAPSNLALPDELPALDGAEESTVESSCIDTGLAEDDMAEDDSAANRIATVSGDDSSIWPDKPLDPYGAEENVAEAPVITLSTFDAELSDGDAVTSHSESVSSGSEKYDSRETAVYDELVTLPESGKMFTCGSSEWSVAAPVLDVLPREKAGHMERALEEVFCFLG
ncbi:hypothetical protein SEPCBS57363_006810, partial [Sporothrix epigloea]